MAVSDYVYDDLDRPLRVTENLTAVEGGNRVSDTVYYADDSVSLYLGDCREVDRTRLPVHEGPARGEDQYHETVSDDAEDAHG